MYSQFQVLEFEFFIAAQYEPTMSYRSSEYYAAVTKSLNDVAPVGGGDPVSIFFSNQDDQCTNVTVKYATYGRSRLPPIFISRQMIEDLVSTGISVNGKNVPVGFGPCPTSANSEDACPVPKGGLNGLGMCMSTCQADSECEGELSKHL